VKRGPRNDLSAILKPGIEPLFGILARERLILEGLRDRMWEATRLIATGRDGAFTQAVDRVAVLEAQLGTAEMIRALVVAGLAESWALPEYELSLRAIIRRVPEHQAQPLEKELEELLDLAECIQSLKRSIARLSQSHFEEARRRSPG